MAKFPEIYIIPSGINKNVADVILDEMKNAPLEKSRVTTENPSTRNSLHSWIHTDHWISGMMSHFIYCANINAFEYDLSSWTSKIQYTVYEGKGTGYTWHTDNLHCLYQQNHVRKLSISLCLSSKDDYDGGELQILSGGNEMHTFKMDIGDVIVFPSDYNHRVRPLKSGKRISLVGWMGGPKFK